MGKKLGYTWYPKDWGNSESVFELNLSERGLYRELIDLAMLNDNKTEIKKTVWQRKFFVELIDLDKILNKLSELGLIEINNKTLFIPSCEPRLNLVRGGSLGGKLSKKDKPMVKPTVKPNPKPMVNQREREIERETKIEKENKDNIIDNANFVKTCFTSQQWLESVCVKGYKMDLVLAKITEFENHLITIGEQKKSIREFKQHFVSWLAIQKSKATEKGKSPTANITI
jgi:hypothetical protein